MAKVKLTLGHLGNKVLQSQTWWSEYDNNQCADLKHPSSVDLENYRPKKEAEVQNSNMSLHHLPFANVEFLNATRNPFLEIILDWKEMVKNHHYT